MHRKQQRSERGKRNWIHANKYALCHLGSSPHLLICCAYKVRDERRQEMEDHVRQVNDMLKASHAATAEDDINTENDQGEEWDGFPDKPELDIVDHEEEYIDEDRYTTVTVETVSVSRDGLSKPELPSENEESKPKHEEEAEGQEEEEDKKKNRKAAKPKKKQFRYESKTERDFENRKQRARNKAKRHV